MLGEGGSWLSNSTRQCGMITDCGKQRKPEAASGCRKQKAEEAADQSDSHANRYHFMEATKAHPHKLKAATSRAFARASATWRCIQRRTTRQPAHDAAGGSASAVGA